MRKTLWIAVAGYVFSVAVLLSFLYWFLKNEGFSEGNFLIGGVAVLLLSVGWGYVIASHLVEPRQHLHEHLTHLLDDILHELKIPLATVDTNVMLMKKRLEDAKTLKRLHRISDASKRLERLYKELAYALRKEIDFVQKEDIDIAEMLYERALFFNRLGRQEVRVIAEKQIIRTDRIGFERVIDNLVSNAMKYSPAESTVEVSFVEGVLKVCDHGRGMDETQLVRIFERYYRGDDKTQGKGIGLSLVKRFCDENGIPIRIDSTQGVGTCVVLDCRGLCK